MGPVFSEPDRGCLAAGPLDASLERARTRGRASQSRDPGITDPIAGRVSAVLGELRLFFTFGERKGAAIWSVVFTGPEDPPAQILVSIDAQWVTVSHVDPRPAPHGCERALLDLNGRLAVAKVGMTPDGSWLAAAQIARGDVDAAHLGDAIYAVLAAVRDSRQVVGTLV